jgi:hypothetical protein
LVEGHTCGLAEEGGEIRGVSPHEPGHLAQIDGTGVLQMNVFEHGFNELARVASHCGLQRGSCV